MGSESRHLNTAIGVEPTPLPISNYHLETPLEQYNLNFCWPVKPLEGSGVHLEPFIPRVHARALHAALLSDDPEKTWIYRYSDSSDLPQTLPDLLTHVEERWRWPSNQGVFAILDLSRPYVEDKQCGGHVAGFIGLRAMSAADFVGEIGPVVILPRAQRTHVTTNSLSLLLKYCFLPHSLGGLELCRVEWIVVATNAAACSVSARFGFVREGIRRWRRVIRKPDKVGGREVVGEFGRPDVGKSWDWSCWALTFKEWRNGADRRVAGFLSRPVADNRAWDA